jgi:GTPase
MPNIIAIVGRPNVGKSTLFNRLTGTRQAIVDEVSGVTRDRHYGKAEWNGRIFSIIDTGGWAVGSDDTFESEIRRQVNLAVEEATIILFVVDAFEGSTPLDEEVAQLIRRSGKKAILVANKVDTALRQTMTAEFYSYGLGEPFGISAVNGSGTGELLDEITANLGPDDPETDENVPRFAIVGRPNVGKSSLLNALLGEDRQIVTDIAGTTRDSIHTRFQSFGHDMILVDTAGLRKKSKVSEDLEFYSVMRAVRTIEECDVCFLMIDATIGFDAQDMSILHLAQTNHKGLVILVNKWDLVEKTNKSTVEFEEKIRNKIAPFRDVPILFVSAKTKQRVLKALEEGMAVHHNRKQRISTSKLNDVMLPIIEHTPPPALKGKYVRIKYVQQLHSQTPMFAFFCNLPQYVSDSYKRFLENKLRENFPLTGVPVTVLMRKK